MLFFYNFQIQKNKIKKKQDFFITACMFVSFIILTYNTHNIFNSEETKNTRRFFVLTQILVFVKSCCFYDENITHTSTGIHIHTERSGYLFDVKLQRRRSLDYKYHLAEGLKC